MGVLLLEQGLCEKKLKRNQKNHFMSANSHNLWIADIA